MEDAHIATVNLGNAPDAAIFGVFDGHGGRCCWVYTPCSVHNIIELRIAIVCSH